MDKYSKKRWRLRAEECEDEIREKEDEEDGKVPVNFTILLIVVYEIGFYWALGPDQLLTPGVVNDPQPGVRVIFIICPKLF